MTPQLPTVARLVHYYKPNAENKADKPLAAIVTEVFKEKITRLLPVREKRKEKGEDGKEIEVEVTVDREVDTFVDSYTCQLWILCQNGVHFEMVPFSNEPKAGHWSWMPYQKEQQALKASVGEASVAGQIMSAIGKA